MKRGAVLVDLSIGPGGCFEVSCLTTHIDITYAFHETLFYFVANKRGAVPLQ